MPPTVTVVRRTLIYLPDKISGGPMQVKAGYPAGKSAASEIEKAIWQEFGTRGGRSGGGWGGPIPERPFMRNAMRSNKKKYKLVMTKSAKRILRGDIKIVVVLNRLGILAQGDIQGEITALRTPPNSPVTIARKGSSNPLIDIGTMRQAATWKLDNG